MTETDRRWMREALELARQGDALASPNPQVGAVLVDASGRKAGSGCYTYAGRKHAEVLALEEAGSLARGGTIYVSLEPCSIQGRTPPCVDSVLNAGISRVVTATRDRNPDIDGSGIERLRAAGVEVEEAGGELAFEAARLNEPFFHFARTGRPLVTLKTALTLDGKIAAPDDNTGWITSATARQHVQGVRHRHDAIMTGIGTVQADDCRLTDRSGLPRRRPLMRIVADSLLRLPGDSRIVETFDDDLVVATTSAASPKRRDLFARLNIPVRVFDSPTGRVDLQQLVEWLGSRQIVSLMIEAGAKLNWAVLEAGVVDKVLLYFAPKILGGFDSLPMVGGIGRRSRAGALQLSSLRTFTVAENEFAVEADIVKEAR
ncbi:MAG: bifunctional diaminohydroxyphosphoribosylaminopyrimidine deaminase/5-amino-6-(5-phosphoribosylamino)uracil reductase RibD [Bryobacterales bacterium]|nr:bifunctional diaminohydroxyphosphoribosylaminopyrimidine deaminase/5-amino-6-(5-phosphoribosylamino)uracil reductase RibD [Bryobacterales bacterium]